MIPLLAVLAVALISGVLYQPLLSTNDLVAPGQNLLLLTAHPDDEAMFFAPTLLALTAPVPATARSDAGENAHAQEALRAGSRANVFSLCLSVGNADGLGDVRPAELERSLDILGVGRGKRWIVDHPQLQDNITVLWDADVIAQVIEPYVMKNDISAILTFDRHGVSSHPNHQALPAGAAALLKRMDAASRPRLFTLITVPLSGKYASGLASVMAKYDLYSAKLFQRFEHLVLVLLEKYEFVPAGSAAAPAERKNILPVFISGAPQYARALAAMRAHASQLVWFRWLYVLFSRYMWINEWAEVRVA